MKSPDKLTYDLTPADEARFWARIDYLGEHWWWTGMFDGRYPKMRLVSGQYAKAGNLALQLTGTPLPPGRRVHYTCMQKQCVNPDHIETYLMTGGPSTSTKREQWTRKYPAPGKELSSSPTPEAAGE